MIKISMTPEQFAAKAKELQAEHGIIIQGNSGVLNADGASVTYSYDGATFTLEVTRSPFLVKKSYCEGLIRKWLEDRDGNGLAA